MSGVCSQVSDTACRRAALVQFRLMTCLHLHHAPPHVHRCDLPLHREVLLAQTSLLPTHKSSLKVVNLFFQFQVRVLAAGWLPGERHR